MAMAPYLKPSEIEEIKRMRTIEGLSLREITERSGRCKASVAKIVAGLPKPRRKTLAEQAADIIRENGPMPYADLAERLSSAAGKRLPLKRVYRIVSVCDDLHCEEGLVRHGKKAARQTVRGYTEEESQAVADMLRQGMTHQQISVKLNRSKASVDKHINRHYKDLVEQIKLERRARDNREIADLAHAGCTVCEIARRTGRSPNFIHERLKELGIRAPYGSSAAPSRRLPIGARVTVSTGWYTADLGEVVSISRVRDGVGTVEMSDGARITVVYPPQPSAEENAE